MRGLLFALALVAVPQEECDMGGGPVRYPGAVQSRNSQQRANALQAQSYARPPAWSSDTPHTVDDVLCTEGNVVLGTANAAYVSRLKRSNIAPAVITGWIANLGNNSGAAAVMGIAIYEVRGSPRGDKQSSGLFLVDGTQSFTSVANLAYFGGGGASFARPFQMDSDKEYALAFYTSTVQILDAVYLPVNALLAAGAGSSAMPQFGFTSSNGWPQRVRFNRNDPPSPGDSFLQYGSLVVLQFTLQLDSKIVTIY